MSFSPGRHSFFDCFYRQGRFNTQVLRQIVVFFLCFCFSPGSHAHFVVFLRKSCQNNRFTQAPWYFGAFLSTGAVQNTCFKENCCVFALVVRVFRVFLGFSWFSRVFCLVLRFQKHGPKQSPKRKTAKVYGRNTLDYMFFVCFSRGRTGLPKKTKCRKTLMFYAENGCQNRNMLRKPPKQVANTMRRRYRKI